MCAIRALAAGAFLLAWPWSAPCYADLIVPVSQTRTITAEATHPDGSPSLQSAEAPDFARFNRTVSAFSGGAQFSRAQAFQDSTISADRIQATGDLLALFDSIGRGEASATSTFDVTFDLPEGLDYRLLSFADPNGFFTDHHLILSGPGGEIAHLTGSGDSFGTLIPGRYRLQSTASADAAFDIIDGRLHVAFEFEEYIPPPPDPAQPRPRAR